MDEFSRDTPPIPDVILDPPPARRFLRPHCSDPSLLRPLPARSLEAWPRLANPSAGLGRRWRLAVWRNLAKGWLGCTHGRASPWSLFAINAFLGGSEGWREGRRPYVPRRFTALGGAAFGNICYIVPEIRLPRLLWIINKVRTLPCKVRPEMIFRRLMGIGSWTRLLNKRTKGTGYSGRGLRSPRRAWSCGLPLELSGCGSNGARNLPVLGALGF